MEMNSETTEMNANMANHDEEPKIRVDTIFKTIQGVASSLATQPKNESLYNQSKSLFEEFDSQVNLSFSCVEVTLFSEYVLCFKKRLNLFEALRTILLRHATGKLSLSCYTGSHYSSNLSV